MTILGMPWLAAHNPGINWETREVKIIKCLPLYHKRSLTVCDWVEDIFKRSL